MAKFIEHFAISFVYCVAIDIIFYRTQRNL